MPREYKPKPGRKIYKTYDEILIKQALEELSPNGHESIRSVAKKYNISRSVLQRHNTREMKPSGGQLALSKETEEHIIRNLNICAEWGYPLDVLDLRLIVKTYLDNLGIVHNRFKNNMPGRDFVHNFLKRHKGKISQRICQNIKRSRAAVTPETIKQYFFELEKSLENVTLDKIINYDETNLSDDPGRKKVITKRGCKYPERVVNHSKASVSIMMAGTAEGELLPPYVCYKATHLYDSWVRHGPNGSRYNRTSSGWFDAEVFGDWIKTIIIPFFEMRPGKKVLIGDNLSSHLSVDLINLCAEKDINFVFLPSNSTHLTQPLDVAFFRPMKIIWRNILQKWKKNDGRSQTCVPKGCFPRMLNLLMEQLETNSEKNLRAGFRKTGISPFNSEEVLSRLPHEGISDDQEREAIDQAILNLLKEMRYGTMGIVEPKKKRKLNVISGRSVSSEEILESYTEISTDMTTNKKTLTGKEKKTKSTINTCSEERREQAKSSINLEKDEHSTSVNVSNEEIESYAGTSTEITTYKKTLKGKGKKTKSTINTCSEERREQAKSSINLEKDEHSTVVNVSNEEIESCAGTSTEITTYKKTLKGKGKKTKSTINMSSEEQSEQAKIEINLKKDEHYRYIESNSEPSDYEYNSHGTIAKPVNKIKFLKEKEKIPKSPTNNTIKQRKFQEIIGKDEQELSENFKNKKVLGDIENQLELDDQNDNSLINVDISVDHTDCKNKFVQGKENDSQIVYVPDSNNEIQNWDVVLGKRIASENFENCAGNSSETVKKKKITEKWQQDDNNDLNSISLEKMPIILAEDLEVYEEIILSDSMIQEKDNTGSTERNDNYKKIIITSNESINSVKKTYPTNLSHFRKVKFDTKIEKKQTKQIARNYYDDEEEILKILQG